MVVLAQCDSIWLYVSYYFYLVFYLILIIWQITQPWCGKMIICRLSNSVLCCIEDGFLVVSCVPLNLLLLLNLQLKTNHRKPVLCVESGKTPLGIDVFMLTLRKMALRSPTRSKISLYITYNKANTSQNVFVILQSPDGNADRCSNANNQDK